MKNSKFNREKGLYPLKTEPKKKKIFGFDTETYMDNQKLFVGSIVGDDYTKLFFNADEFEKILATDRRFRSSIVCATNLSFDLTSIFGNIETIKKFNPIERAGSIVYAFCYATYNYKDDKLYSKSERDKLISKKKKIAKDFYKITFIDSISHLGASVKELGKIINIPKIESPYYIGNLPRNDKEIVEYIRYNINDSLITYTFMKWLQEEYLKLGCELKVTISSTALDLFRRKYLTIPIYSKDKSILKICFKAYYGGRVENFMRGIFTKENFGFIKSYDVNSLYPFKMMKGAYPFGQCIKLDDVASYYKNFEGVGYFELFCPDMKIPLLPVKKEKLLFPTGLIKGYYSFIEIRKALEIGYKLLKTGEGVYWTDRFNPFKKFVKDLYKYRLERKKVKCPTQLVPKILMNSLYGKFAYNYSNKEMIVSASELEKYVDTASRIVPYDGNKVFRVLSSEESVCPSYVHPELSLYVTARARIEMYNIFKDTGFNNILYTDTDCMFTRRTIKDNQELGGLKEEHFFIECCLIKPKMYGGITKKGDLIKIKGLHGRIKSFNDFKSMVKNGKITARTRHFVKIRGSLSGNKKINSVYEMDKEMQLNDDKRVWDKKNFDCTIQDSRPICLKECDYL